jgi:hypothetical protein
MGEKTNFLDRNISNNLCKHSAPKEVDLHFLSSVHQKSLEICLQGGSGELYSRAAQ